MRCDVDRYAAPHTLHLQTVDIIDFEKAEKKIWAWQIVISSDIMHNAHIYLQQKTGYLVNFNFNYVRVYCVLRERV